MATRDVAEHDRRGGRGRRERVPERPAKTRLRRGAADRRRSASRRRLPAARGRVGRLPRHYRGRDAFEWMQATGQLDLPSEQAEPAAIAATPPQVSGAGGGRTVSYQHLAARGVTLLGRANGWDGRRLVLAPDLGENVRFADESAARFRTEGDQRAARNNGRIESARH